MVTIDNQRQSTNIGRPNPNIKIEKKAEKEVYQKGEQAVYTITVSNTGNTAIKDIIVKETMINGEFDDTEGITKQDNNTVKIARLEVGEVKTLIYRYNITEKDEGKIENKVTVTGTPVKIITTSEGEEIEEPLEPITDDAKEEIWGNKELDKKSRIKVTKEAEKEIYKKGEVVNYTIRVSNIGETLLKDVMIKENLLNGKFEEKLGITLIDDQTVKIDKLEIGQSIELIYQYTVGDEKLIGEKVQNKVVVTGTGIIENPEDPENPITEEVRDEDEIEIIVKNEESADSTQLGIYKTDVETGKSIKGAVFGLYTAEDIIDQNNKILVAKDTLIEMATTNQAGYARFTADLPISKYYILELKPATGYIENTEKLEIDATSISSSEKEYCVELKVQNKKTDINIEKIEQMKPVEETEEKNKREQIEGAILQIQDGEGNVVEEWLTEKEPHNIKGLETNKEYTLHEVKPAKGYVTTKDIKFSINLDGSLNIEDIYTTEDAEIPTIIMQDEITKVKITIIDKETKDPIKDIVVQIVDKETGEVVYEFTTDGEEHIIEKIPIGNYEIREKDYPKDKGYVPIETEELTIKDTPEVQEKVIEQDYTKLDISFIDEITKELLPGGKLEIRNEEGEVIGTIDDTGIHTYVERLPAGEYTIIESEVPEGYEPIEKIKFTLKDVPEVQYVVIENKRLPFDLQVEKYASSVSVNEIKRIGANQAGQLVKVELDRKKIASQNVEIEYTIKVTNTGEVAGSVGEIVDKIPLGLTFNPSKNESYWKAEGRTITSTAFADRKIQPKESIELKIVLDWAKNEINLGEKENIVTIGGFTNNPGFEDKDENNNISRASVLLSVKTGMGIVLTKQILVVVLFDLIVIGILIGIEIAFIKKKTK